MAEVRPDTSGGFPLRDDPVAATEVWSVFLAHVDRGDNAANDELVTELVRRIRTQQAHRDGDQCGPLRPGHVEETWSVGAKTVMVAGAEYRPLA